MRCSDIVWTPPGCRCSERNRATCWSCAAGVRLISSERLAAAQREWATEGGVDSLFANGSNTRWGLGYHLYPFSLAGGDTPRPSEDETDDSAE